MQTSRTDLLACGCTALLVAIICLIVLFSAACGYAEHKDPALYIESSATAAKIAARLRANEIGGSYHENLCCGSMQPLVYTGDWLVVAALPYDDQLLGRLVVYQPKWSQGQLIAHRLVSGNAAAGFIASGDNNPNSEATERVRRDNYHGAVIAIYRPAK